VVGADPGRWFSRDDGFLVADLGGFIRDALTIRLGHDDRLYRYDGGVYRTDGERAARVMAKELLAHKFKRRHLDELVAYLRADYPFITEHPPRDVLNVANGLLDWRTLELRPHSPDVPSAVQVPPAWNPEARCPRIERFLADVLPDDAVEHGLEILGYGLYAGNPLQRAVMTLGPGGNGKSVYLTLARALYGRANVSATSLQALSENRFSGAELFGRLANICGDLDARAVKRTDLFKQLTGGDLIQAERKFAHPFSFTCFALPLFSANEAPLSSDQTDAWFDRWLVVPFEVRVP
jgi:phage/plasmid-associated DNA primase